MRVPLEWLHEYCRPAMDAGMLAERLALTGTEVERVEHHGVTAVENFVVGHVLERKSPIVLGIVPLILFEPRFNDVKYGN